MMDFEVMFRRPLEYVGAAQTAVLATPYDLPIRFALDLFPTTNLKAVIANSSAEARNDATCAGWWVDRDRGRIFLRRGLARTLIIAGVDATHRVGAHIVLEARLKNFDRVVTSDWLGSVVEDIDVRSVIDDRVESPSANPRVGSASYAAAFDMMYEMTGDALKLKPWDFDDRRVMIACGTLGPGGAERQASMTAVGLQQSGLYDAYVMCNFIEPPADFFRPMVEKAGAHVVKIEQSPTEHSDPRVMACHAALNERFSSLRFGEIYLEIVRYASIMRTVKPAVVHTWMDYCNSLAGTAAALIGVPGIVLGGRSVAPWHFRIFQPYMKGGYDALLKRRRFTFLNNSRAGARDYEDWLKLPRGQIRTLNNGFEFPEIDRAAARTRMRDKIGVGADVKLVGSILRFSEEKRPQLLIDMAREIHARDPAVRFVFFGGGAQLEDLRRYVAGFGLSDVIQLPGLTDASWDALAAMDVFVLASRMEGLPNVMIEAQATGVPVVCTAVGGMPETYVEGITGIGVSSALPVDLALAVLGITGSETRLREMSEKAYAHARKVFSMQNMVNETIDAYASALREPEANVAVKVPA